MCYQRVDEIDCRKCDSISGNSRRLKRTQLNYKGDGILAIGDPGSQATGGYQIPGVKRFGVVNADLEKLHPWIYNNDKDWEFHHDTKAFKEAWDFVKILDRRLLKNPKLIGSPVYINCDELEGIDSPIKSEGEATEQPSQNHG